MNCPQKIYNIECYKKYGIKRGQSLNAIRGRLWEINHSKILNNGDHRQCVQSCVFDSTDRPNDCKPMDRPNDYDPSDRQNDCKPMDRPNDYDPTDRQNDYCDECNKKNCCDDCNPSGCSDDCDSSECSDGCESSECSDDCDKYECCDDCDVKCNNTCHYIKLHINSTDVLTKLVERLMNILKGVKNNIGVLKLILMKINSAPLSSTYTNYLNTKYMSMYRKTVRLLDYIHNKCHFFKTMVVIECCLFNRHLKSLSEYKSITVPSIIIDPVISGHPFSHDMMLEQMETISVLGKRINRTKKIIRLLRENKSTEKSSHKT